MNDLQTTKKKSVPIVLAKTVVHSQVESVTLKVNADKSKYSIRHRDLDAKKIDRLTKLTRTTYEYEYIFWYIKHVLDVSKCAFYADYSMANGYKIELNHAPFTLYDICHTVAAKHIAEQGWYETFQVTKEVAMLHFKFKVGFIPLSPGAHKLYHAGLLPLHPDLIIGYYKEFMEEYSVWIPQETRIRVDKFLSPEDKEVKFPEILRRKHTYLDQEGVTTISTPIFGDFIAEHKRKLIEGMDVKLEKP